VVLEAERSHALRRIARDVLHADVGGLVAGREQVVGEVAYVVVKAPVERGMRQAEHADVMRVAPGVERCAAGAALGRGGVGLLEQDAVGGQRIQGVRGNGAVAIAGQVPAKVVAVDDDQVRKGPSLAHRLTPSPNRP